MSSSITNTLIKDLNKKVLITDLCTHYNITLQSHGNKLYGYCPFHEDGTLSFIVFPRQNRWKCMRACCGGGDNIHFIMKIEKISFQEAIEKLLEHFNLNSRNLTGVSRR